MTSNTDIEAVGTAADTPHADAPPLGTGQDAALWASSGSSTRSPHDACPASPAGAAHRACLPLPVVPTLPARARAFVVATLVGWRLTGVLPPGVMPPGLPTDRARLTDTAAFGVSELATNAWQHVRWEAFPAHPYVTVTAELRTAGRGALLVVAVHDPDPRLPRLAAPLPPDAEPTVETLPEHGYGLPALTALAREWSGRCGAHRVRRAGRPLGKSCWFSLRLTVPAQGGESPASQTSMTPADLAPVRRSTARRTPVPGPEPADRTERTAPAGARR